MSTTTSTATAAIRDARVLGTLLERANVVISQHNAEIEFRDRPGEYRWPVGWDVSIFCFAFFPLTSYSHKLQKIAVYFKLGTRLTPQWDGASAHAII